MLRFQIYLCNVLPHNPKTEQLESANEKNNADGRSPTIYWVAKSNFSQNDYQRKRQILMRSDIKLPQPFVSWSNSR